MGSAIIYYIFLDILLVHMCSSYLYLKSLSLGL